MKTFILILAIITILVILYFLFKKKKSITTTTTTIKPTTTLRPFFSIYIENNLAASITNVAVDDDVESILVTRDSGNAFPLTGGQSNTSHTHKSGVLKIHVATSGDSDGNVKITDSNDVEHCLNYVNGFSGDLVFENVAINSNKPVNIIGDQAFTCQTTTTPSTTTITTLKYWNYTANQYSCVDCSELQHSIQITAPGPIVASFYFYDGGDGYIYYITSQGGLSGIETDFLNNQQSTCSNVQPCS